MTTFITLTEEMLGLQPGEKLLMFSGFDGGTADEYSAASGERHVAVTRGPSAHAGSCYIVPLRLLTPWVGLPVLVERLNSLSQRRVVHSLVWDGLGAL